MSASARRIQGEGGIRAHRTSLARRFQLRYALALGVFALLLGVTLLSMSRTLATVEDRSAQLVATSTQISRLYRIEDLAAAILAAEGDTAVQASDLRAEVNTLRQVQTALAEGDVALRLPYVEPTQAMIELFGPEGNLDADIEALASNAQTVSTLADRATAGDAGLTAAANFIVETTPRVVATMTEAQTLYRDELRSAIDAQRQNQTMLFALSLVAGVVLVVMVFQPLARQIKVETRNLEQAERQHRENNERQTFRNDLQLALEHVEAETEIIAAVGRAIENIVPENRAELLLADPGDGRLGRAQVNPIVGAAGCPIDRADHCPAIRRGQNMVFESSRMLNVCPKLPQHGGGGCSAVCAPLMFSGQALGVLHVTGKDGTPPSHTQIERLGVLATETSSRLGTLRASQATELQATTDGLTGLWNRRSLEERVRALLVGDRTFSVALADLDHFKDLNDTYGHEAGDRALRQFAKVLQDNLRPEDFPGRYGGEEFVVLLPDTTLEAAQLALERLQHGLAVELAESGGTPFTASWGLTSSNAGADFDEIVAVADTALYAAKRSGRNCIVIDTGSGPAPAGPVPTTPTPVGADGHQSAAPTAPVPPTRVNAPDA